MLRFPHGFSLTQEEETKLQALIKKGINIIDIWRKGIDIYYKQEIERR